MIRRRATSGTCVFHSSVAAKAPAARIPPSALPTLVGLLAAVVAAIAFPAAARADTDAQKLAVAKRMFAAWHALDWPKVYDLFADDGVLHSMMDEPVVGRAAVRERLGKLAPGIERIELQVKHLGVIDGRVFVERVDDFVYRGHHGRVPVVGVLEIDGGKVKVWREYYDRAQLLREMGVAPPAAPAHPSAPAAAPAARPPAPAADAPAAAAPK